MKGGFLHNQVVARDLVGALRQLGAKAWTEYPVRAGSRAPAVDIYVELAGLRIACEIEIGPQRIANDIAKAQELGVDVLLVVTPTAPEARRIRKRLGSVKGSPLPIQVLPFGLAVRYLSEMSHALPLLNEGTNSRPETAASRRRAKRRPA